MPGIIRKSARQGEAPTYSKIVSVGSGGIPPTTRELSSSPVPTAANGPTQHQAHQGAAGSVRPNGLGPREHSLQMRRSEEESSSDVSSSQVSSGSEALVCRHAVQVSMAISLRKSRGSPPAVFSWAGSELWCTCSSVVVHLQSANMVGKGTAVHGLLGSESMPQPAKPKITEV